MFFKAVSIIAFLVGILAVGLGVLEFSAIATGVHSEASAIQITQVATQSTFAVVCGLWFVLFGFAVGAISVLREIRKALTGEDEAARQGVAAAGDS